MKTYQEFFTEATDQQRVAGGYFWIEEMTPGDPSNWKVTVDKGNKRVTLRDNMDYYQARTYAGNQMMKVMVANPTNKYAAKMFRRKGNTLVDPFAK